MVRLQLTTKNLKILLHQSNTIMPQLPTPHYDKIIACLKNPRLPDVDKERFEEAVNK